MKSSNVKADMATDDANSGVNIDLAVGMGALTLGENDAASCPGALGTLDFDDSVGGADSRFANKTQSNDKREEDEDDFFCGESNPREDQIAHLHIPNFVFEQLVEFFSVSSLSVWSNIS